MGVSYAVWAALAIFIAPESVASQYEASGARRARPAAKFPGAGRHNIWEIVIHAAYWKHAVRRRLLGEKRGSFSRPGSNWFALPSDHSEKAWRADVALLEKEHKELKEVVSSISPEDLDRPARGSKTVARRLILGIAFHDVYHAGQIQLIKKFIKIRKSS